MNMNLPGADKFLQRMFRKAEGVVWDLMSGKIGVQTEDGIATLEGEGEDARVSVNLFDDFGVALPAFAQSTPVADVKVGDIIYSGKTKVTWVIEKKANGTFKVMKPNGETTTWNPPKVNMLGFESGVMVLRSLMTMLPGGDKGLGGLQNTLMPLMLMGGDSSDMMEKIMPMILMGQMNGSGTDSGGMGNMMNMMLMMQMMKGDNPTKNMFSGKNSPFNK